MPAYFIADIVVTDLEAYKPYVEQVPAIIAAYGGRYLVRGGEAQRIEGDRDPNRIVVLEFKDKETALNWYNSEEYQAILPYRLNNSTGSSILVEGLSPPM